MSNSETKRSSNLAKIAFITLTNKGYLQYTLNFCSSLKNIGYLDSINIYAIGQRAYDTLMRRGLNVRIIDDETNTEFQIFRKGNWAKITYYKFVIISENLANNEYVLFADGDIVFKDKNFLDYCMDMISDKDLLIQNDGVDDDDDGNLCSGFMLIRSNERTKKFFDPKSVISEVRIGWDDQVYINKEKSRITYNKLPLHLFPNGRFFYNNSSSSNPFMIHFNWVRGHEKAYVMLQYGEFYSLEAFFKLAIHARQVIIAKVVERLRGIFR